MAARALMAALLAVPVLMAQQAPPATAGAKMPPQQVAREMYSRTIQLMESGGFAIPDLARAGQPLIENIKQTIESLEFLGWQNPTLHYRALTNLRAFLLISDAVPKPVPYPESSRKQLAELRDNLAQLEVYFQGLVEQLQRDLRSPDRDNVGRYAEQNTRVAPPAANKPRVVFLGDSITDSWRLNEYFPQHDFINRGISGQITSQMLARFLPDVAALKPEAVLILAGTNDIARGVSTKTIQLNLTAIADLADKHGIKPVFSTILPVSDYHKGVNPSYERTKLRPPAVINEMNGWLKTFCQQRGYVLVNYFDAMKSAEGQLQVDLGEDGLHPNAKGYRVMAPLALGGIEQALTPVKPEKKRRRLF